ncbi:PilZ domain-containing protein [Pseudomonas indica]|uniref:PilZ domain-containing protein n=1 Tax=Pseudomonas indica TaxID=137658 RepID=UPI000BAB5A41|nr:PilZ domain-containing protein [Pseudomonas indica]PAU63705.1 pilus assembly protein PilZ [Pseudomonas indica]
MSTKDVDDRREYYRITDMIALEIRPAENSGNGPAGDLPDTPPLFNLLSELHLMDFESQHLLRHISERDRTLANYLKVINKRIDLLGQALAQGLLREIGTRKTVVLSEGGINFTHSEAFPAGTLLALRMVLMPQALGMLLQGRVVHCQSRADGSFEIGAEFEALTDAQRQLLARHILQKQALERRQARERPDPQ